MFKSPNLQFNLLVQNQSQKEVTVNEALIKIDALLNNNAISMSLNIPPADPKDGDLYIIGDSATESWGNKNKEIAYYYSGHWYFITPKIGCTLWVADKEKLYAYTQNGWTQL